MFKEGERVLCIGEFDRNRSIIGHIGRVVKSNESFTTVEFNCYVDGWLWNSSKWCIQNDKLVSMDRFGKDERVLCTKMHDGNSRIVGHIGRVRKPGTKMSIVDFSCDVGGWDADRRLWGIQNNKLVSMDR